jgi:AraC family ethanolamine operon transcriptional activator
MDTITDSACADPVSAGGTVDKTTSREQASNEQRESRSRLSQQRVVRRASEFLRDHAAESVRIRDLSRLAGVSERTLRNAFHREHGLSPKQFDLRERLEAAHRALCDTSAPRSVTNVASQFGFFELGRFARVYKQAFGESPSQTIKNYAAAQGLHAK